jgi:hypothetical protein
MLAEHLGTSRQNVHTWRKRKIPAHLVPQVALFTGIPPELLRPDLARIMTKRAPVKALHPVP